MSKERREPWKKKSEVKRDYEVEHWIENFKTLRTPS